MLFLFVQDVPNSSFPEMAAAPNTTAGSGSAEVRMK